MIREEFQEMSGAARKGSWNELLLKLSDILYLMFNLPHEASLETVLSHLFVAHGKEQNNSEPDKMFLPELLSYCLRERHQMSVSRKSLVEDSRCASKGSLSSLLSTDSLMRKHLSKSSRLNKGARRFLASFISICRGFCSVRGISIAL